PTNANLTMSISGGNPAADGTDDAYFLLFSANGLSRVGFEIWEGTLNASQRYDGGAYQTLFSTPIDPVAHKYLRVSVTNGTVSWQTSPDKVAFTTLVALPAAVWMQSVVPEFGFGTWDYQDAGSSARFDELNR